MIHYPDVTQAQKLCECLASPARVEIMRLVLSKRVDSMDELAKTLHLTNGAISQHVKKLCDAGLVRLEEIPGKRGTAKRCVPAADRIIIDVATDLAARNAAVFDLPIGQFSMAAVHPYCAIATAKGYIGERDDPRYFTYPERIEAALIYFNSGRMGWTLPSPARKRSEINAISVTLELSSKPYGHGQKRDSDVTFFLNDQRLGSICVDGEFTDRKGLFTPAAFDEICEYGRRRTVRVDRTGAYADGIKLSDVSLSDIDTDNLTFYLSAQNGVALFGHGFGDYNSGIKYKVE